jgi:hypothetical protein
MVSLRMDALPTMTVYVEPRRKMQEPRHSLSMSAMLAGTDGFHIVSIYGGQLPVPRPVKVIIRLISTITAMVKLLKGKYKKWKKISF